MSEPNLRPEDIDRLGQALLALTRELWVVKDRVRVLEAALVEGGTLSPDTVDRLQPGPELTQTLEAERMQLINAVLAALETRK
jgi:hypothetical protein